MSLFVCGQYGMEMPIGISIMKNGVFHILNHMVKPRNTHGQTRGTVMKLTLGERFFTPPLTPTS